MDISIGGREERCTLASWRVARKRWEKCESRAAAKLSNLSLSSKLRRPSSSRSRRMRERRVTGINFSRLREGAVATPTFSCCAFVSRRPHGRRETVSAPDEEDVQNCLMMTEGGRRDARMWKKHNNCLLANIMVCINWNNTLRRRARAILRNLIPTPLHFSCVFLDKFYVNQLLFTSTLTRSVKYETQSYKP